MATYRQFEDLPCTRPTLEQSEGTVQGLPVWKKALWSPLTVSMDFSSDIVAGLHNPGTKILYPSG